MRTESASQEAERSSKNERRVDRRTVLRGAATAAVGLPALAGTAAAFEGDDGDITGPADFPRATTRGHFDIHWWCGD